MSPWAIGRLAEKHVKNNLWRRNYRVKDVSRIPPQAYDLLVSGKYRVEVKSMRGSTTSLSLDPKKFDILCIVVFGASTSLHYSKNKKSLARLKKGKASIYHINPDTLSMYFTKKPQEVFK